MDHTQLSRLNFLLQNVWESQRGVDESCLHLILPSLQFHPSDFFSGFLYKSDLVDEILSQLHGPFAGETARFQIKPQNRMSVNHSRRPRFLRKMKTLKSPELPSSSYSKVVERVLDCHSHKFFRQSNISCMIKHPLLPLVFLACERSLLIVSCWTQSIIADFAPPKIGEIRNIRIDPAGSKVILLDSHNDLILLKVNNFGRTIFELCRVCEKKIIDVIFISGGSQAILLVSDGLLLLSLLTQKLVYLYRFEKKEYSGGWSGPKTWAQGMGIAYEILPASSPSTRVFDFYSSKHHVGRLTKNFEKKMNSEIPEKSKTEKTGSSGVDLMFCKTPSLSDGTLIYDEVFSRLLVLTESSRQIIFFDLKTPGDSTLQRKHLSLSYVLFFGNKAKLINYCFSRDERHLFVVSRDGVILQVGLEKRIEVARAQVNMQEQKNNKIIAICQFDNFLVIEDKFSKISMINF